MKFIAIALLCSCLIASSTLFAQMPATTIERTEISGISEDKLSEGLRADLQKLVGQAYDEKAAGQIAERMQTELPEYVATATTAPGTQANRIAVVFVVAHNINSKYIVESVDLKGTDKSKLSEALWAEVQKMVGHPVDDDEADRIQDLIGTELKFHHIRRSIIRGNQPQHVRILYEKPDDNSIGFDFTVGYHSRNKFSGRLGVAYSKFDITGIHIDAYNNNEQLIERYAGIRYGYWIGYKRVRFNIDYSSFKAQWSSGTLMAAANATSGPGLYRLRDTIAPTVKLTINPFLHVTLGIASSQLQLQNPNLHFESVRTATGNLDYSFAPLLSENHRFSGSYDLHVAGDTLGSSKSYTRHLWDQSFTLKGGREGSSHASFSWDRLSSNVELGRITGNAPMFERFSMGNSNTLFGWDKNEIAPLGASRMAYGSVTLANQYGAVFFESGALWDNGHPKVLRKSVGLHLFLGNIVHGPGPVQFLLNMINPGIGIPLRSSNVHPIFTFGGAGN